MGRFSRRRFLTTVPTLAGAFSLGNRIGLAQDLPEDDEDLTLWYRQPASQWVDALPIGNGLLGAMVFGGGAVSPPNAQSSIADGAEEPNSTDPAKETLSLNEDTLWSGRPLDGNTRSAKNFLGPNPRGSASAKGLPLGRRPVPQDAGLFVEAYQPAGRLHVDCAHAGKVTEYRRELDLRTAEVRTTYKAGEEHYERTAFASAPDQVIVLRIAASQYGALNATVWMDGALARSVKATTGSRLLLSGKAPSHVAGAGHPDSERLQAFRQTRQSRGIHDRLEQSRPVPREKVFLDFVPRPRCNP